jgi:hypothetical protein
LEAYQGKTEHAEVHIFLPPSRHAIVICEVWISDSATITCSDNL